MRRCFHNLVALLSTCVAFLVLTQAAGAARADEQDWDADENTLQLKGIPSSLKSHRFTCAVETPRALRTGSGRVLWIGTWDGLWRWRRGASEAEKIVFPGRNGVPLPGDFGVNSLLCLENNLWIGSAKGLYLLDLTAKDPTPSQDSTWPVKGVNCLARAGRTLWVGTETTLYRLNELKQPTPVDRKRWKVVQKLWKPVNYLAWDRSQSRLWVATPDGIFYSEEAWAEAVAPMQVMMQALAIPGEVQAGATLSAWARVLTGFGLMSSHVLPTVLPYNVKSHHFQDASVVYTDQVDIAALHPYEKTLWVQLRNRQQDVVRLKNVMCDQGRGVEREQYVDFVSTFVEWRNVLWIGAQNAPEPHQAPNARAGLFRWMRDPRRTEPRLTGPLITDEVVGLSRTDDTLWMATRHSLYRLNGLERGSWHPSIVITDMTRSRLMRPIFTGNTVRITWKNTKNLAGRTTPGWIEFKLFIKKDGEDHYHEEGTVSRGNVEGEWEATYTTHAAGSYRYEVRAYDLAGNEAVAANDAGDPDAQRGVTSSLTVHDPLLWYLERFGPLLLVVFVLAVFLAPLRRAFLVRCFGYRYRMTLARYPDFVFVAVRQKPGVFTMERTRVGPIEVKGDKDTNHVDFTSKLPSLPSETEWIRKRQAEMRGQTALVRIAADDFGYPLALLLGGNWATGRQAVIAGQVIYDASEDKPKQRKDVCFAVMGCRQNERGQLDDLPKVPEEVVAVERVFRQTGATVLFRKLTTASKEANKATIEDFRLAMRRADVVHVAAHASAKEIQFFDGPFHIDHITDLDIRCRLLILSACRAADFRGVERSLARVFVSRDVNVLASLEPVSDDFCETFFPSFYEYLLPPHWHFSGVDVGTAIRMAAAKWVGQLSAQEHRKRRTGFVRRLSDLFNRREFTHPEITRDVAAGPQARDSIDSFVLFGNPCLQIRLSTRERTCREKSSA